jgi:hypothetical protein
MARRGMLWTIKRLEGWMEKDLQAYIADCDIDLLAKVVPVEKNSSVNNDSYIGSSRQRPRPSNSY